MRTVLSVTTGDDWTIEITANRPLTTALVDRLAAMRRALAADQPVKGDQT